MNNNLRLYKNTKLIRKRVVIDYLKAIITTCEFIRNVRLCELAMINYKYYGMDKSRQRKVS